MNNNNFLCIIDQQYCEISTIYENEWSWFDIIIWQNFISDFLYFIKTFDKSCAFTQYVIDNHKNKWLKTRNF